MSLDPRTLDGYIGSNGAHQSFKREIVNAKVLFLQIRGAREQLKKNFEEKINNARRAAPGSFSIGMVTEVISPTQIGVLNIPHNEADLVARDYDALETQFNAILYCDLQRILESFLLDLYAEIARKEPRVLTSKKTVTFEEVLKTTNLVELLLEKQLMSLSHADREIFEDQFADMGLPIVCHEEIAQPEREVRAQEFRLLWGVRNVLQHSHGIVNALFLRKVPNSDYKLGDQIVIDAPKLGRAFAAVESIADELNKRAIIKYDISAA
jgi:hypothetical protein